jgi:hypothetical protein
MLGLGQRAFYPSFCFCARKLLRFLFFTPILIPPYFLFFLVPLHVSFRLVHRGSIRNDTRWSQVLDKVIPIS